MREVTKMRKIEVRRESSEYACRYRHLRQPAPASQQSQAKSKMLEQELGYNEREESKATATALRKASSDLQDISKRREHVVSIFAKSGPSKETVFRGFALTGPKNRPAARIARHVLTPHRTPT